MYGQIPQQNQYSQEELEARVARIREDPHLRGPGKNVLVVAGAGLLGVLVAWWAWSLFA